MIVQPSCIFFQKQLCPYSRPLSEKYMSKAYVLEKIWLHGKYVYLDVSLEKVSRTDRFCDIWLLCMKRVLTDDVWTLLKMIRRK